jgi:uncharacterized protein (DUF1697 family)
LPRYVAFLRGVSPGNANMAQLKHCFDAVGFTNVKTVLSSGNVAFDARAATEAALERKVESAMAQHLDRTFYTIVRPTSVLRTLLETDPYAGFRLATDAKRVVSLLRAAHDTQIVLPIELDGARILASHGREIFTAYVPSQRGPVFMTLIEKTFGKNVTTRTWETIKKCVAA